jgi:hypothetical protein
MFTRWIDAPEAACAVYALQVSGCKLRDALNTMTSNSRSTCSVRGASLSQSTAFGMAFGPVNQSS